MDLKSACLDQNPGNREFWDRVSEIGRDIGLISKSEAERLGGKAKYNEAFATEVSHLNHVGSMRLTISVVHTQLQLKYLRCRGNT